MIEEHGLLQSSVQQLHDAIGSMDGGTGVPSTICRKRKSFDNNFVSSSKSSAPKSTTKQSLVGSSIKKHGKSIIFLAKMVAPENEKNHQEMH